MSTMPTTPGPWRVSDRSIVTDEYCIAVVDDHSEYADWERWRGNAALLAAAPLFVEACTPERLDALENVIEFANDDRDAISPGEIADAGALLAALRAACARVSRQEGGE